MNVLYNKGILSRPDFLDRMKVQTGEAKPIVGNPCKRGNRVKKSLAKIINRKVSVIKGGAL